MKTETKEIYRCEFCNKLYLRKHACIIHEKRCKKRPDYLRPCHSCVILKKVDTTIFTDYGGYYGECEEEIKVLYCEKLDSYIYPPSVEAKRNAYKDLDKSNIVMPKQCEFHKEQLSVNDTIEFFSNLHLTSV